jgi:hypothetical protein
MEDMPPDGSAGSDGAIYFDRVGKCLLRIENVGRNIQPHFATHKICLGDLGILGLSTITKPTAGYFPPWALKNPSIQLTRSNSPSEAVPSANESANVKSTAVVAKASAHDAQGSTVENRGDHPGPCRGHGASFDHARDQTGGHDQNPGALRRDRLRAGSMLDQAHSTQARNRRRSPAPRQFCHRRDAQP